MFCKTCMDSGQENTYNYTNNDNTLQRQAMTLFQSATSNPTPLLKLVIADSLVMRLPFAGL